MSDQGRVHVVDDDEAMRDSLSFMFQAHGMAVRSYPSAEAFLQVVDGIQRGCVVTDVRMPGIGGVELVRRLVEQGANLPVVVITGHGDVPLAVEAMKSGAADFIEKPFDDLVLVKAVNAALAQLARASALGAAKTAAAERLAALSGREQDVLAGLLDGKPNKVIARDLGISPRTVEVYRAHVMTKTGASSLPELVRLALLAKA
jgi:two-component system response regulator FixJ